MTGVVHGLLNCLNGIARNFESQRWDVNNPKHDITDENSFTTSEPTSESTTESNVKLCNDLNANLYDETVDVSFFGLDCIRHSIAHKSLESCYE